MNRSVDIIAVVCILFLGGLRLSAQCPVRLHSHNDYERNLPFYEAYSCEVASIEADVYYVDGEFLVGHDLEDLNDSRTLEDMYLKPVSSMFRKNGSRPYRNGEKPLQLFIDIKSSAEPFLAALVDLIESEYKDVFCGDNAVQLVITGNRPSPSDFKDYPCWVYFDGALKTSYSAEQLKRVALFSECFTNYTHWNGKNNMFPDEEKAVKEAIRKAHEMGKPIRFWGTPETETLYYTFYILTIDYINTDNPRKSAGFFSNWADKIFHLGARSSDENLVSGTTKLDKATRSFGGFHHKDLVLEETVETYVPTYKNDGSSKKIKNVILMIGDGMGLNQILAGYYANSSLSLLNFRYMGLQLTPSKSHLTTDSAGAGSAISTGEPNSNRHIASHDDGTPIPSLTDYFSGMGYSTGVVTLGNLADATPAAFYAHNVERNDSDDITSDLISSDLDILCGSGKKVFTDREDGRDDFTCELSQKYDLIYDYSEIPSRTGRVVCVDESMGEAANQYNLSLLSEVTSNTIEYLQNRQKKGFFLMVEGAKIDYAGHSRCLPGSVLEMLSFDLAVSEALKFADENGETLVIVTGDHETGGLVIMDGDLQGGRIMGMYHTNDHTPSMLPVFAYGPHADSFIGTYRNIDIPKIIKDLIR